MKLRKRVSGILLQNAWVGYQSEAILKGATLSLAAGETAIVAGANGTGKSTLLYACAGLIPLRQGSLELGGKRATGVSPGELFRGGVRCGFVFQEGGLMANMNALANVALALRYHADSLGLSIKEIERRAKEALNRVRIRSSDFYELPAHLSFGTRKRLAVARAIALEPTFFFFDDPDVGLDPDTAAVVHEILCGYRDDPDVTTLVATNRVQLIDRLRVRGLDLQGGRLFAREDKLA